MNTKINLTWNGEKYVLEYNRASVRILEQSRFVLDEFLKKPMTNIELAFAGSFLANHKKVSQNTIDDIFKALPNKDQLIVQLTKMIQETYESLLEEPEEGSEGNVSWEAIDLSPKKSQK